MPDPCKLVIKKCSQHRVAVKFELLSRIEESSRQPGYELGSE
jgi:hypothetical protein